MSDKLPDEAIARKEEAAKAEPSDQERVDEPASDSANDKASPDKERKKSASESSKKASTPEDDSDDDQDDDDDDDEEEEEEEVVKPKPKAKTKTRIIKKLPPNAIVIVPTPPKKMSSATALIIAAVGLGAYWKGLQLYNDVQQDYYSHCAWLLLIGLVCVTLSAFHFIGAGIRKAGIEEPAKKPSANAVVSDTKPSVGNVIVALLPALPFAGVYLSLWYLTWDQVWTKLYPNMAWLFFLALGLVSWGAYVGLKPPTEKEEQEFRMPDRRVTMLVVLPFVLVFGMIWFASSK